MRHSILIGLIAGLAIGTPGHANDLISPKNSRLNLGLQVAQNSGTAPLTANDHLANSALEAYQGGKIEQGLALAQGVRDPSIRRVLDWLEISRRHGNGYFHKNSRFIRENPDWPGLRNVRRQAERTISADISDGEILAWFAEFPAITVDGGAAHARALLRSGQSGQAKEVIRTTWIERNFTEEQEADFRSRFAQHLTRADHLARLDRLLWDHRGTEARRMTARLGSDYRALANARLSLAARSKSVDGNIKRLPAALHSDPGFIYERARWRLRKGRYEGVAELLRPLDGNLPELDRWWRLREWTARKAIAMGDYALAYRLTSNHGFTSGVGFADGEWLAGWVALRFQRQPGIALRHFATLFEGVTSPISRSRGAYWAGEAAAASGDSAGAQQWYERAAAYPTAFYGQRAYQRLNRPLSLPASTIGDVTPDARAAFEQRDLTQIARALHRLGQRKLTQRFLYALNLSASTSSDFALTAALARELNRPDIAVSAAKLARREGIVMIDELFPIRGLPRGKSPEPALLLGLMRQESVFDDQAISRAGARGLMQLMPGTAKLVTKQIGLPYSKSRLTEDPDYNMRLGSHYLAGLLDRFSGSYILSLAGYNAGPHRSESWIERNGDPRYGRTDPIDWIEMIPFSETRNYVQRVLESLAVYRLRLPGKSGTWEFRLPERTG